MENTDYRKFDDGLRMTVDCSSEPADIVDALGRGSPTRCMLFWNASTVGRKSYVLCAITHAS
ncbi:DUF3095 family protein [Bradyrhizobium neotropicale]|uniref:DUF3095 family protein n=1 Tax=Bradyrhizobium neotropicale TaxID=1497615 RepID=UPI003907F21A